MRVLRGVSRFSRIIGAGVLFASALGLWSAAPASATSATNETCYDVAQAQPTQAHQVPSASSPTEQSFSANTTIYGNCNFWDNIGEGHWYMRVYLTNGKNGGVGYIWVQRLAWGSQHECFVLGDQLGLPRGVYRIVSNTLPCPLTNIG
jgi:hypothetical protein